MSSSDLIIGRAAIASRLGYSERTVSRKFAKDELPGCIKIGGPTAPLRMTAKAMDKLLSKKSRK